jgi:pimeloyl-ACP methyl ester carboxylesterase
LTERTIHTNGVDLYVVDEGPAGGTPVILAHGFPELSYSWRHQIPFLAANGCRVLAPDQRGYGRSDRPEAIEDYDIVHLTDDLLGLLDDIGEERAIFVGHDWGSMVVWQMSLLHPERVAGVVGMSVPFSPRSPFPPVQAMKQFVGDNFFYIVYFQEPGPADRELGADAGRTMRRLLAGLTIQPGATPNPGAMANDGRGFVDRMPEPDGLPDWLTQEELDHYTAEFSRTGFTGGINWYRNFDRNWEKTPELAGAKVEVPALFIGGAQDPVLVMASPANQEGWLVDHRGNVLIEGAGHWVQQETPEPVNAALLDFVNALRSEGKIK